MFVSFTNTLQTATWSGASEDAQYPASNLAYPSRPFKPGKTTSLVAQAWLADMSTAQALTVLWGMRCNFTALTIQGNATNSWGAPSFTKAITVTQNPYTGRYQFWTLLAAFNYRYLRLVPSGTPVSDEVPVGATPTVYSAGGFWGGADVLTTPTQFTVDWEHEPVPPYWTNTPSVPSWSERKRAGDVWCQLSYDRKTFFDRAQPGAADALRTWLLSVDRAAMGVDAFALAEDPLNNGGGNPALGWIVRDTFNDMRSRVSEVDVMQRQWELHEVIR